MIYEKDNLEYWDHAHRVINDAILPGNDLDGHLCQLKIDLPPTGPVLCIGVGIGGWVRELHVSGHEVWALDVSSVALAKVADCAVLAADPQELPEGQFICALSLWVAPHMRDKDLAIQLQHVIHSLSDEGVLAIHYNEPLSDDQAINNYEDTTIESHVAQAGKMLRTRATFLAMVADAGGVATIVDDTAKYPAHAMQAVMAHVRKKVVS